MAGRGNPKTQFKKGQTGNPNGRPTLPPEIRSLKKLTVKEFEELVSSLMHSSESDLDAIDKDPSTPYIRRIVVQILKNTYKTGNMTQFDLILSRVIGKVKEKVELMGKPSILITKDGRQFTFTNKKEVDGES